MGTPSSHHGMTDFARPSGSSQPSSEWVPEAGRVGSPRACRRREARYVAGWDAPRSLLNGYLEVPAAAGPSPDAQRAALAQEVASRIFAEMVGLARKQRLRIHEHFSVNRTLVEAWASPKGLWPMGK